jgi:hypothetical protein
MPGAQVTHKSLASHSARHSRGDLGRWFSDIGNGASGSALALARRSMMTAKARSSSGSSIWNKALIKRSCRWVFAMSASGKEIEESEGFVMGVQIQVSGTGSGRLSFSKQIRRGRAHWRQPLKRAFGKGASADPGAPATRAANEIAPPCRALSQKPRGATRGSASLLRPNTHDRPPSASNEEFSLPKIVI